MIGEGRTGRIGFDARLIGALGIGRYITGLLPPLATLLGERLVIFARTRDAALVRAIIGARPTMRIVEAAPYRLAEQTRLPLTLRRERLALMHFPHYNLPLYTPGPFVATIHDLFPFEYPEIHSGVLPRLVNQLLLSHAIRGARLLITPSDATKHAVRHRFPGAQTRIRTIPEATDGRFGSVRDKGAEAAWQTRLAISPPYVLYLGQWKAYKNLPLLLRAFAAVRARIPDAQLVVAGDDPRHPEVRRIAGDLPPGSVVLPGRLPDAAIPDLYRGAAAVALPSQAEGFGLPVIEAMASGVRVICSDIPALREIADGIATFCDPNDPRAFADAIVDAITHPDPGARERGLERARAYSWRRTAEETALVYEQALSRSVGATLEEDASGREHQDLEVQG